MNFEKIWINIRFNSTMDAQILKVYSSGAGEQRKSVRSVKVRGDSLR
jgi:hypothetical protein